MILYVRCCPREESRTDRLAKALLTRLGEYTELDLYREELPMHDDTSLKERDELLRAGDMDDPRFRYARQFAAADEIVIAAPYWDLSFPAKLRAYIENIYVVGIVSEYDGNGIPRGLCRAKRLWYVTTAGGPYDWRFSYDYISTMATDFFGIRETRLLSAEMLDIAGNDPEKLLADAIGGVARLFEQKEINA